jgi:predicted HicB family RNase H-like nuclease
MEPMDYSGQFRVRIDPDLHAHLVALAKERGISLNLLVTGYLAGASGFKLKKGK